MSEAKAWREIAARRGLLNMNIQGYSTTAAINLKRFAAAVRATFRAIWTTRAAKASPRSTNPAHSLGIDRRLTAIV